MLIYSRTEHTDWPEKSPVTALVLYEAAQAPEWHLWLLLFGLSILLFKILCTPFSDASQHARTSRNSRPRMQPPRKPSSARPRSSPVASRVSVDDWLAELEITAPRSSPSGVSTPHSSIPDHSRDLFNRELELLTRGMDLQDQIHQLLDLRVQDMIQDVGHLRDDLNEQSIKQYIDIQEIRADMEQLRTDMGPSFFVLNQKIESLRQEIESLRQEIEPLRQEVESLRRISRCDRREV